MPPPIESLCREPPLPRQEHAVAVEKALDITPMCGHAYQKRRRMEQARCQACRRRPPIDISCRQHNRSWDDEPPTPFTPDAFVFADIACSSSPVALFHHYNSAM